LDRKEVFAFTEGCFNGEPASCTYACPFHLDLRSFLKKAARGRWDAAYKEYQVAALFPSVVSGLCPRSCEGSCQQHTVCGGDAVAIGLIERACIAYAQKKEAAAYAISPKNGKVAVVGAGPAGLSCALLLAQKQYQVTVFERNGSWGGSIGPHPGFAGFEADFISAFSSTNVVFRYGTEVSSLSELDGFDAVLFATGLGGGKFGFLGSWDAGTNTTDDPRVYLAGEVTGVTLIEGMAQATNAVRSIEAFLLSGNPVQGIVPWDRSKCTRYAPHGKDTGSPRVTPTAGGYTAEEAKAEATRCLQCDCDACLEACELLVHYKKKPPRISNDVFMDGQSRNSVSSASITRQTWSCNLCGYCGTLCGKGADLRGLFQLSRADRVRSGLYPPALHDYWLKEMAFAAGENSLSALPPGRDACEYAFFPGCRLGASNPDYVLRPAAFLTERLGAGVLLNCCGAPAYWAGDSGGLSKHLSGVAAAWASLGKPKLVTACATCERMLAQFLPEVQFVSLYEVLLQEGAAPAFASVLAAAAPTASVASAPAAAAFAAAASAAVSVSATPTASLPFQRAAVFDPCAAAGKIALKQAVRQLAAGCGITISDYDNGGKCCGFGGHMQLANRALYDRITEHRAAEAEDPYIVYCGNCRDVFLSAGKACAHILDAVFGLEMRGLPTLEEKKGNSIAAKQALASLYQRELPKPIKHPWDSICVTVSEEAQEKMERLFITLGDVREAVWRAEEAGDGFVNEQGDILCSHAGDTVTYWVRYSKGAPANRGGANAGTDTEADADTGAGAGVGTGADTVLGTAARSAPTISVQDVYSHRMRPRI
jgi:Fe-S oxidoreductase